MSDCQQAAIMSEHPSPDFTKYDAAEALQVFRIAVQKVAEMRAAQRQESGDVSDLMRWAEWRIDTLQTALERSAGERVPVDEATPPLYSAVWTDRGAMVWDGSIWREPTKPPAVAGSFPAPTRWELKRIARERPRPGPTWWLRERR